MRSIRVDLKYIYETQFPDLASLEINDKNVIEFKPLHNNSSLKKRKDKKIFIRAPFLKNGINRLKLKEFNPNTE